MTPYRDEQGQWWFDPDKGPSKGPFNTEKEAWKAYDEDLNDLEEESDAIIGMIDD